MNPLLLLGLQAGETVMKGAAGGIGGSLGAQAGYGIGQLTGYNKAIANDQYNQQKRLSEMQQELNFKSMDKAQQLQKDMIDYTDPSHQMARLEAAGLNTAMMYGGTGAGGSTQTTGNTSPMGIQGGHASGEAERKANDLAAVGMGLQLQMMESQIKVNESVANKNNTDAEKTGGIDTENAKADLVLKNINNYIANKTQYNNIENAYNSMIKLKNEAEMVVRDNSIQKAVKDKIIESYDLANRKAASEILKNRAGANLDDKQADIAVKALSQMDARLIIDQEKNRINEKALEIELEKAGIQQKTQIYTALINGGFSLVSDILSILKLKIPRPSTETHTTHENDNYDKDGNLQGSSYGHTITRTGAAR